MQKKVPEAFTETRCRKRRFRDAEAVEGVRIGEGCLFPSRLVGLGSVSSSLAGSGAVPRPQAPFQYFLSVTEDFNWKGNAIHVHNAVTEKVEKF